MEYLPQLNFLCNILKDMNISGRVLANSLQESSPKTDFSFRTELFGPDNNVVFLQNAMSFVKEKTIYRFFDAYGCNYILLRLPEPDTFFLVGPYLLALPSRQELAQKMAELSMNQEKIGRMQLYYASLPLLENEKLLITMINTFAKHLWGAAEQYAMEYMDDAIPDRYAPVSYSTIGLTDTNAFVLSALEKGYASENELMEAVSKGKLHLVTVHNNGADHLSNDSLRDRKNHMIVLKTLLRKAAEYGGVHPMHLHRLSTHYAQLIENTRTVKQSVGLQEDMIRDFCKLVKHHSLSQYSYYVGQAITMVQYDLTADLKLKTIAEKLNVNSSYLSTLFHKEVGCTLTDYINKQRIAHSIRLLQLTSKHIQDISAECGFQDVNYFIKLFKKQTGTTPSRYRTQPGKQILKKGVLEEEQ